MFQTFKKFLVCLFVFSLLLGGATFLFLTNIVSPYVPSLKVILFIFGFFIVTTAIIYYIILVASVKRPMQLVTYFTGTTSAKMLLYIGLLLTYGFTHKSSAKSFILFFLALYVFYTCFEV